jgi:hypothetical protein
MVRDLIDKHLDVEENQKAALKWLDKRVVAHAAFCKLWTDTGKPLPDGV